MCSRFGFVADVEIIKRRYNIEMWDGDPYKPRFNVAPNSIMPIVTKNSPNSLHYAKWGLIPSWSKEAKLKFSTFNARAETVDKSPAYRESFKKYRCLVPATHYFEWAHVGDKKIPHLYKLANNDLFSFAGLYSIWKDAAGEETWTFTIVTCPPNPLAKKVHDRMPVLLDMTTEEVWLEKETPLEEEKKLLQPYEENYMTEYLVNPEFVNKVGQDSPKAIEKI